MRWQWHILFLNYYFRLQALLIQCVTWHLFLFFLKMCISCVYLVIQRFCVVKGIQWIIIEITKKNLSHWAKKLFDPANNQPVWAVGPQSTQVFIHSAPSGNATPIDPPIFTSHIKSSTPFWKENPFPCVCALFLSFWWFEQEQRWKHWQPAHLLPCCSLFYDQLFFCCRRVIWHFSILARWRQA